ncbi:MAG: tRNA pseudouridine(55) synthase TruB, partial [Oscillospiraceae bacterium]|nr:tRNA pseudouridine(55) synthase TruB [Oscillospiraceae bacterium]
MNGILLIDKPEGWTSMDVCAKLRGVFHEKRIGHSGTLDPMATGLLVVFLGRATRAVEFAEAHSKEYVARLRLGVTTDTQDTSGNVLSEREVNVSEEQLLEALEHFKGEIDQIPPMYSAIKIGGKKLYEIARKGESVERKPRRITIHSLEFLGWEDGNALLRVRCSKGTYIRTLCHDIGEYLGCGGCMASLRRTAAGEFSIDAARSLEAVIEAKESGETENLLLPVDS